MLITIFSISNLESKHSSTSRRFTVRSIRRGICLRLGMHMCQRMYKPAHVCFCVPYALANATTCTFSIAGGGGGGGGESQTLWFMNWCIWSCVESSSWESACCLGEGGSGVVAGSRSVGEEQPQQTWQRLYGGKEKEEMIEQKRVKQKRISAEARKSRTAACCFYLGLVSLRMFLFFVFFSVIASVQLLLVTELIVNWSKKR